MLSATPRLHDPFTARDYRDCVGAAAAEALGADAGPRPDPQARRSAFAAKDALTGWSRMRAARR